MKDIEDMSRPELISEIAPFLPAGRDVLETTPDAILRSSVQRIRAGKIRDVELWYLP